jgi:catechol 2,3-dioxygenase
VAAAIHPETGVGPVELTVRDIGLAGRFYEEALGLVPIGSPATLGIDGRPLVELFEDRGAPRRPPGTTGLFHLAVLVPDRLELARSLRRLVERRWPLLGASDHLVSEALYLADPEGNGIEVYSDRPRSSWRRADGEIQMATLPLDLRGLMRELERDARPADAAPAGATRMGHVHLNVADLDAAEAFYAGLLGLDVTARGYPGALFLSAGGYHHHVGLNTWAGAGAPPPPEGSAGLRSFELTLPDRDALEQAVGRLRAGGVEVTVDGDAAWAHDPSRNPLVLRPRPAEATAPTR